ncbi:hypothetical protein ACQKOD_06120 [Bacillus mycoides]|uniref:hypothetical protein n=1 Tax=Bacillus mycoides TaxID=1405 RepID=UPI001C013759|nr:hypothetical protein [Bacillus mycoides]QWG60321.1 hypothetical protein EXW60_04125 [Bacillus mycoides]QWG91406.1 hypothetical protein EXW40_20545 [Bacillus mycoides]QWJ05285.1 hypothetical protein J5V76_20355 [Bacillus mycoides]
MKQRELTTYEKIVQGYAELTKEVTKEEDKAAMLTEGREKVAEGVEARQTGKTFYEMFAEGNPFTKGIAPTPYMLVSEGYAHNKRLKDAKTTK